jgi:hypothetical protein
MFEASFCNPLLFENENKEIKESDDQFWGCLKEVFNNETVSPRILNQRKLSTDNLSDKTGVFSDQDIKHKN